VPIFLSTAFVALLFGPTRHLRVIWRNLLEVIGNSGFRIRQIIPGNLADGVIAKV
jgi:hypothetical protein